MKKYKKAMSIILVFVMMLVLFPVMAQASVNVSIGSNRNNVLPGAVFPLFRIHIRSAAQDVVSRFPGDRTTVRVTLPSGVIWNQTPGLGHIAITFQGAAATSTVSSLARENDNRTAVFTVESTERVDMIALSGIQIDITNNDLRGIINAEVVVRNQFIDAQGAIVQGWEQRASVPIFEIVPNTTTVWNTDARPNVVRGAANQLLAGIITIDEIVTGTFATSSPITITAPPGVTFVSMAPVTAARRLQVPIPGVTAPAPAAMPITVTPTMITATTTAAMPVNPARIEISNIRINVEPTVPDGLIIVNVRGTNIDSMISIGTVGVIGNVSLMAITDVAVVPVLNAGRLNQLVSGIRLTESIADVLPGNRELTLTLPQGFTWHTASGFPSGWATPVISNEGRTLTTWTPGDPGGTAVTTFNLSTLRINTHGSAINNLPPERNIAVTVGGSTGVTGEVTVAFLRNPVTLTASAAPDIRADSVNQTLGDLIITETHQMNLIGGTSAAPNTLTITLPPGTSIAGTPAVTVADVEGSEPAVTLVPQAPGSPPNVITLNVVAPSPAATNTSTITVSGLRIDLARVPAGTPIKATVAGTALLQTDAATGGLAGTDRDAIRGTTIAAEAVLGNVVSRTARRTVFTIGSTAFTAEGAQQPALDVAPIIKDGRTMMPIRAAANAAGVTDDNILFEDGVITIIRGNRFVQFTIGSKTMVINGRVNIAMDVAPLILNGRVLLPMHWLGAILGVPVVWDGTNQTVTINVE